MDCNDISIGITSLILMAMLQNPVLLQKVLKDWFLLPERQEIFPGLILRLPTTPPLSFFGLPAPPTPHSDERMK